MQILSEKTQKLRLNIVGAGKVASTMSILWHQTNQIHVQAVWNRSSAAISNLQHQIPHIHASDKIKTMPPADIIVIGVSDNMIKSIAEKILLNKWITPQTLLLHFSGALESDILIPKEHMALTGSIHPVFAFSDINTAIKTLPGHLCAIEGQSKVLPLLHQLTQIIGLETFVIKKEQKKQYHAALSISANFLVTLNAYARQILASTSIPAELTQRLVNQLMKQNIDQLEILPPSQALTGPIKRGDSKTIAQHWAAIREEDRLLYKALALQTLELTTLDTTKRQQIEAIFTNER